MKKAAQKWMKMMMMRFLLLNNSISSEYAVLELGSLPPRHTKRGESEVYVSRELCVLLRPQTKRTSDRSVKSKLQRLPAYKNEWKRGSGVQVCEIIWFFSTPNSYLKLKQAAFVPSPSRFLVHQLGNLPSTRARVSRSKI